MLTRPPRSDNRIAPLSYPGLPETVTYPGVAAIQEVERLEPDRLHPPSGPLDTQVEAAEAARLPFHAARLQHGGSRDDGRRTGRVAG
jgi:hypothetical protein